MDRDELDTVSPETYIIQGILDELRREQALVCLVAVDIMEVFRGTR